MINLFMNADLVRDLIKYYYPLAKVIRKSDKSNLVKIDRVCFMEDVGIIVYPILISIWRRK